MQVSDIMAVTFDDVPDSIEIAPGEYMFEVARASIQYSEDGEKHWFEFSLRPVGVLSEDNGIDDEALTEAYPVKDRIYFHTPAAKKYCMGVLTKILNQDVKGIPVPTLAEAAIGQQVRAIVAHKFVEGKDRPYLNINNYLKTS